MTSEERQQQINTLVERLHELDLEKRAMDLVLQHPYRKKPRNVKLQNARQQTWKQS